MQQSILVLDCGATNIRAVLVDEKGSIVSHHAMANSTVTDSFHQGGLLWDVEAMWAKMCQCTRSVIAETKGKYIISGVTVTTFGVDGAPISEKGQLLYPVISWQCSRTEGIVRNIGEYFDLENLYKLNGLQSYHFNTLYKLIWLWQNKPEVLQKAYKFLFIPSLFIHRMTGQMLNDTTMAGTSMLTSLKRRDIDDAILASIGIEREKLLPLAEPGSIAGHLIDDAANDLGVAPKIPVIVGGHDTQFAVFAAGASSNKPVLSSGTWEILMARANTDNMVIPDKKVGVTIELDAEKGLVNPGVQWVASGVLEWVVNLVYADIKTDPARFDAMIREAEQVEPGCNGVRVLPELFPGGMANGKGCIEGLKHTTTRAHIYRATLEALSFYLRMGMAKLENASTTRYQSVICVGGGSRNKLWNQIRADVLGIPIITSDIQETTVMGAACFAMAALGWYKSPSEALSTIAVHHQTYKPSPNTGNYHNWFEEYANSYFS